MSECVRVLLNCDISQLPSYFYCLLKQVFTFALLIYWRRMQSMQLQTNVFPDRKTVDSGAEYNLCLCEIIKVIREEGALDLLQNLEENSPMGLFIQIL